MPESDRKIVTVDQFHNGMCLSRDIYDEDGILLLAAHTKLTEPLLELLRCRNIRTVRRRRIHPDGAADHHRRGDTRDLDASLAEALTKPISSSVASNAAQPMLSLSDLRAQVKRGLDMHSGASRAVGEICRQVHAGVESSGAAIEGSIDAFVEMISMDRDVLSLILSMQEAKQQAHQEYLFDHCVNVALLSMSMAAQLGWNREQIVELGYGAMLQDVGMLDVPTSIRFANRRITADEWSQIRDHPYHTLEYLERIADLPLTTKFIAYQSHEREDRSGYPKNRSGMYLHPYAKIVGIADCYCAMTGQRPHRPAMMPYQAAKTILLDGSAHKFDRTLVSAFLDAISLFPIGSFVELSDGKRARVIRANPGLHTRPVVVHVDAENKPTSPLIDLSQETGLKVVRALPTPNQPV